MVRIIKIGDQIKTSDLGIDGFYYVTKKDGFDIYQNLFAGIKLKVKPLSTGLVQVVEIDKIKTKQKKNNFRYTSFVN